MRGMCPGAHWFGASSFSYEGVFVDQRCSFEGGGLGVKIRFNE